MNLLLSIGCKEKWNGTDAETGTIYFNGQARACRLKSKLRRGEGEREAVYRIRQQTDLVLRRSRVQSSALVLRKRGKFSVRSPFDNGENSFSLLLSKGEKYRKKIYSRKEIEKKKVKNVTP